MEDSAGSGQARRVAGVQWAGLLQIYRAAGDVQVHERCSRHVDACTGLQPCRVQRRMLVPDEDRGAVAVGVHPRRHDQ